MTYNKLLLKVAFTAMILVLASSLYAGQITVELKAGSYDILVAESGYHEIRMEGFGFAGEVEGTPRLPGRIFMIALPPGARVISVDYSGQRKKIKGQYKIEPAPPLRPFSYKEGIEDLLQESGRLWQENYNRVYSSDSPYPEKIAWKIGYGTLRNIPYIEVLFSPFAYNPETGRLSICRSINIIIDYIIEDTPGMHDPIPEIFINQAEEIFANFEDVRDNYSVLMKGRGTADYLIILYDSTSTTVDAIQPLINWKKSRGYTVKVVDCGNAGYSASSIRNYLRTNYSGWGTVYVLLVAPCTGAFDIPMCRCYVIDHAHDLLTDYYYAELSLPDNQSWDDDSDGWYGEYSDDNVTFVPEVYVGRIPFNANTQHDIVRTICERTVDFDSDLGGWKDDAMLLGAIAYFDTLGNYWDCSNQMEYIKTHVGGLTYTTMYEEDDWIHPTPACNYALTEANVVAQWGTGNYAIFEWASHGGVHEAWRSYSHTGPPQVLWDEFIRGANGPTLSGSAPIAFSSCCWTGNIESADGCLATELMENDATSAFMGATRVSYNNQPWLTYYFIDHLMGVADLGQVGRAFYNGKVDYWSNYGGNAREQANMLMFNLYGDPNLLRSGTNALPNVTYTTPTGWSYSIVPRSNGSATWTNCLIPSTLPGNSNTTYINWAIRNSGSVIARDVRSCVYLDDGAIYIGWIEWINPYSSNGHQNAGPITVRGGRHTLMDSLDYTHTIYETNEYDNRYRRQFIWSPYQLANQTPVLRSAPPLKGSMSYPNCDGFSFPDGSSTWWRGVGILPTSSGNDYDLRLHNDYTGSTQGFGNILETSTSWGTQSDFVLVNENGGASSGTYYAGVIRYSGGTSNFYVQRADDGATIYAPDTTSNFTIHSNDIIDVHEIRIPQKGMYRFTLDNISGTADLGITLYDAYQPFFGKWDYLSGAYSNSNGDGQDESFTIEIDTFGYFGFVVWKSDHTDLGKSNTYKIMIERKEEGTWEGDVSSNWHTAANWFGGSVPTSSIDVFIPSGTPYSPVISTNHANCLDLTVDAGATLTLTNKTLYADGNVYFNGTINATGTGYYIRCRGNWLDYGNFNPGTGYYVIIDGSTIQYIINGDFYNLTVSSGSHARILWSNLQVDGYIHLHGTLDTYSTGYDVSASQIIVYNGGTLDSKGLNVSTSGDLRLYSGGYIDLDDNDASISSGGDIVIDGSLDCGTSSPLIYCNDDWIDTSGTFIRGYSTACFNGTGVQDIMGSETFWDVVVDKTAGKLRPYDSNIAIHSLIIEDGTFDLNSYDANIASDAIIRGHLEIDNILDDFNVDDDIIWDSTATATITNSKIRCGDDFDVYYGADIQMSGATVYFLGATNSYIHMYDPDFSFNNLMVSKDSGYWLKISNLSTYPVDVNGYFYNNNLSTFDTQLETIEVAGNWTNDGIFTPTSGLVRFDGTSQLIDNSSGNFWDIEIDPTSTLTINDNLDVDDDFTILSGTFNPGSYNVYVGGDWNDTLGIFQPFSTSNWVIFDGGGQQLIYQKDSNHFQGVEIWNTATPPAQVRAETDLDILWYFNITSGDFNVNGQNLYITNALQLGYFPSHDGNLTQYDGAIHCNGVRLYAGTVDLFGGTIYSTFDNTYYPDWNDTLITFQAWGNHTVEMIGSTDITITQKSGNYFNNLTVNKQVKQNLLDREKDLDQPITCTGFLPPHILRECKTNTVLANTDFDVNGNLLISNGILEPGGHTLRIAGNWTNDVGDAGFIEGTGNVIFDGASASDILTDETFFDLTLDKTYINYDGLEIGTDGNGKNINVLCNLNIVDGTMELNVPCTLNVEGDVQIALNAGINANDGYNICVYVGGNWVDNNPVHSGTYGFDFGISDVIFDGNGLQDISGDSVNFYNLKLSTVNAFPRYDDLELIGANKLLRIHNDLHLERGGMEVNTNSVLDIDGDVVVDSAAGLDVDDGGIKIHVAGDWTNTGNYTIADGGPTDGFDQYTSSVIFDGTGDSHIGEETFDTLRIDKGDSKSEGSFKLPGHFNDWTEEFNERRGRLEARHNYDEKSDTTAYADSTIIANDIWVDNGRFFTSNNLVRAFDDINLQGTLKVDASSILQVGDTLNINNGGRLECIGTDTSIVATVTRIGGGYYALNVNAGGTISPTYTVFEYMDTTGINISGCALVDTSTSFDYCKFRNGQSGGTLLRVDNSQDIQIVDAIFPENIWGGFHNASKLDDQGTVTFIYPYGSFAGEDYEDDPFDRIFWTVDTIGPVISYIYPPQDTLMRDNLPTIEAHFHDTETGIKTSSVSLKLDDTPASATVTDSSIEYTPAVALSDTIHEVELSVCDNRGNQTIFSWEFEVDANAPMPPVLYYPPDSSWVGDTTVCFQWGEVLKSTTGDNKWQRVGRLSGYDDFNLADIRADGLKRRPLIYIDEKAHAGNREENIVGQPNINTDDATILDREKREKIPRASEVSYIIQVDTSETFIDPIIVDTTYQPLDTLNLDQEHYYWRVIAFDLAGNIGDFSSVWEFGIDIIPPDLFDLISPIDSICISMNRPQFLWHSTVDTGCGLKDYRVYIDGDLKHIGVDTFWTANYDLPDDYHNWYVVAFDSTDNTKQSNQVWALLIDTQSPEIESTTVWSDTTFTGPFQINTNVSDTNGVYKVDLLFRTSVDTNWVTIAMDTAKAGVEFTAEIPTQPGNTTVDYYIYVEDNAQPPNEARDPANAPDSTHSFTVISGTGVMEEKPLPEVFSLSQNRPNPFAHSTTIEFGLPVKSYVSISIYNISGLRVTRLIEQEMNAGYYETEWDGRNDKGDNAPQGIYFCQFTTESFCKVRKIVLLR